MPSLGDRLCEGVSSSIMERLGARDIVSGSSWSLDGLDDRISVGEDTFARSLSGEVSAMFKERDLAIMFGDGRDDVGLFFFTAEENCVWPKSWLPASGAVTLKLLRAKGFVGIAGVSGAAIEVPAAEVFLSGVSECHAPLVFSNPASSDTCDDGRGNWLGASNLTAPVSSSSSVHSPFDVCCVCASAKVSGIEVQIS